MREIKSVTYLIESPHPSLLPLERVYFNSLLNPALGCVFSPTRLAYNRSIRGSTGCSGAPHPFTSPCEGTLPEYRNRRHVEAVQRFQHLPPGHLDDTVILEPRTGHITVEKPF